MALWWLLSAGVAPVGLVGVPCACEVGRFACGSELVGVPFPCGARRTCRGFGAFGTFEAWQMAAVNAYKRSHCCGRGVLLSHCCGLVVAFACSVGVAKVQERQDPRRGKGVGVAKVQERDALTTERYAGKRPARVF